jgi:glycosyltransferase involved in cell wall biosynthesis
VATVDKPILSVVVPVYNEESNLDPLWESLRPVLEGTGEAFEVIFVDDGSRDDSGPILDRLADRDPRVRVLHLDSNHGQSAAFDAGFRSARADWVITIDADLQNDPGDIATLLSQRDRADVICGVRVRRHDSWIRRISSRIANSVRNRITKDRITDTGCSLKVFRRDHILRVHSYRGFHRFLPTLLRMEGARVIEVPVRHHERHSGTSKYGVKNRMWSGLMDCLAVRWMRSRCLSYEVTERAGGGNMLSGLTMWVAVGLLGQALFSARFIFQWIVSERRKESVIPVGFWYLSLGGSLILLTYAIHRQDPVFILGQSFGSFIYIRNLVLISRRAKRAV